MNTGLYSPKIREDLVRQMYLMCHGTGTPMTHLVNRILEQTLAQMNNMGLDQYSRHQDKLIKNVAEEVVKAIKEKSKDNRQKAFKALKAIL